MLQTKDYVMIIIHTTTFIDIISLDWKFPAFAVPNQSFGFLLQNKYFDNSLSISFSCNKSIDIQKFSRGPQHNATHILKGKPRNNIKDYNDVVALQ